MSGPSRPGNSESQEKAEMASHILGAALSGQDAAVGMSLAFVDDIEQAEDIAEAYGRAMPGVGAAVSGLYGAGALQGGRHTGAALGATKEEIGFAAG
jgi:hypothetical protein